MIRMIKAGALESSDFAFLTGWDAALMPLILIKSATAGRMRTSGVVPGDIAQAV
ncbi:MAG: hypothetical protein U0903_05690 [Planctomycetales bacterium]